MAQERAHRNYANGKVYMIESLEGNVRYIGSTCGELRKRMGQHKNNFESHRLGKFHYVSSFDVLRYPDARILLVEDYPCERLEQLVSREAHHIRTSECVNKVIPNRTRAEYYQDNRAEALEKATRHYRENKEEIMLKAKAYYNANKASISEKSKKKMMCEVCGYSVRVDGFTYHSKTKKHAANLASHST